MLLPRLDAVCAARLPQSAPTEATIQLAAFTTLRHRPVALLDALAEAAAEPFCEMPLQHVISLLWALQEHIGKRGQLGSLTRGLRDRLYRGGSCKQLYSSALLRMHEARHCLPCLHCSTARVPAPATVLYPASVRDRTDAASRISMPAACTSGVRLRHETARSAGARVTPQGDRQVAAPAAPRSRPGRRRRRCAGSQV